MARKLLWHLVFQAHDAPCCGSRSTRTTTDKGQLTCPKCIAGYDSYRESELTMREELASNLESQRK